MAFFLTRMQLNHKIRHLQSKAQHMKRSVLITLLYFIAFNALGQDLSKGIELFEAGKLKPILKTIGQRLLNSKKLNTI